MVLFRRLGRMTLVALRLEDDLMAGVLDDSSPPEGALVRVATLCRSLGVMTCVSYTYKLAYKGGREGSEMCQ